MAFEYETDEFGFGTACFFHVRILKCYKQFVLEADVLFFLEGEWSRLISAKAILCRLCSEKMPRLQQIETRKAKQREVSDAYATK